MEPQQTHHQRRALQITWPKQLYAQEKEELNHVSPKCLTLPMSLLRRLGRDGLPSAWVRVEYRGKHAKPSPAALRRTRTPSRPWAISRVLSLRATKASSHMRCECQVVTVGTHPNIKPAKSRGEREIDVGRLEPSFYSLRASFALRGGPGIRMQHVVCVCQTAENEKPLGTRRNANAQRENILNGTKENDHR